ncbi:MAG: hypothetical protein JKX76_05000 [Colwellia sp.]|nr:hypothetical protein [Colwellia sp.]
MLKGVDQKVSTGRGISYLLMNDKGMYSKDKARIYHHFQYQLNKAPQYQKRLRFFEVAQRTISKKVLLNFHRAMNYELVTYIR